MKKHIAFVILSIGIYCSTFGQDILVNSANNGQTFTQCTGTIYDSGGNTGSYGNSQDFKISIMSNNATQPGVTLKLLENLSIASGDTLWIYDGDGTSPSQLFHGGPNNLTFFNDSNMLITGDVFQMSIFNTSQKITVRFKSNSSTTKTGFKISIMCSKICQSVFSRINTTLTTPQPDTNYIAVCPYDTVKFVAFGYYPMTDTLASPFYHQRDATSTFYWDFGDGTTVNGLGMTNVNHYFVPGIGYDIMLIVKDTNGCQSNNSIGYRVMTSQNPISTINPLPSICSGGSLNVGVGYSGSSSIQVVPVTSEQIATQVYDSTMFIPDGVCNGVACYTTNVIFNAFGPSQTIQSSNDILSLCINIEHSWVGDLHFELICPNGQSTKLMNTTSSGQHGGNMLGVPNENDAGNVCDPSTNPPGTGWTYCWSEQSGYTYHGTLHDLSLTSLFNPQHSIDSTNRAAHSNYIVPEESFNNLIGCPLNGTWRVKICDLWSQDNGYVFWWNLEFNPSIMPVAWHYNIGVENVLWSGPFISSLNDSTAHINPAIDASGNYNYTFTIVDTFGCQYDSTITLNVLQTPDPNLGPDTTLCNGGTIVLNPHYNTPGSSYLWNNNATTQTLSITAQNTYIVSITNTSGSLQCKNSDTINVTYSPDPVANFSVLPSEGCSPLVVQFTDESTPTDNYTYAWDFGDPSAAVNTSTLKNPIHQYNQYGSFDVSLSITAPAGCHNQVTKTGIVTVHPTPIAKFTGNPSSVSLSENPNVIYTNQTENYIAAQTTWSWIFPDGQTSTDMNPTHQFTIPGDFPVTLIATNNFGCSDTVTHITIVENEIFIPNIITPNGDNNNDFLIIGNINTNRDNILKIYDRWGKKVYEKKNYNTTALCQKTTENTWSCESVSNLDKGWNGEGVSDGVYFYTFHYEGVTKVVDRSGSITVLGSK